MIRLLFKPLIALCTMFIVMIGLIRAQPYDSNGVRAFLMPPDDCAAPCFIGIRPGVTTRDEAIAILEAHPWIKSIDINNNNHYEGVNIAFAWHDTTPHIDYSLISSSVVTDDNDTVVQIQIPMTNPFYQVLLEMGTPDDFEITQGIIVGNTFDGFVRGNQAYYTATGIRLMTEHVCILTSYGGPIPGPMRCPVRQQVVWKMHTDVIIGGLARQQ